jgi:hypothetical protein
MPLTHGYENRNRGLGIAEMAYAIRQDRPHRASGALVFHVHDIMHAIHDASEQEEHITLESQVDRPAPLPPGLDFNVFVE